ncbi:MAG: ATP-binding protein [Pseudomonadota bacterium]|nr:ATP-binding protein [Pseudomonadota bacterium]MEC8418906.1 ATP-binding protein [Pseudomonadota bacterium]
MDNFDEQSSSHNTPERSISDELEGITKDCSHNTLYEKLQSVANIGTWAVDLENSEMSWSSQTKAIHEVPSNYVPSLETSIGFYKEGYDRDEITRIVSHAIKTGEPWNATLQLVTAKGNSVWIETHGMVEMRNGKCVRLFGTFQNVDKSVKLRLELEHEKREAQRASRQRGMLLSRISHELKTPLNGITGMLQAIKFEARDGIRQKKADLALHSADRLLSLINDVLDYTAIINGELTLKYSDFCIRSLVEDIVDAHKSTCKDKGIRLFAALSFDDLTYIHGDAARISQVITHLLSNAVKFTDTGFVSIHVSLKQRSGNHVLLVSVEDSGVGMGESELTNMFRPFENDRLNASEDLNGNGLGLSIINQLVERMNGELDVRSTPGKGSCFDVTLPVEVADAEVEQDNAVSISSDLLGLPLNILVVDDNDINRLVLGSMLEKYGYVPDEAENGEVAVQRAREKQYDLVFMDYAMPLLDGVGATHVILQEQLLGRNGAIIAVTANTSEDDKAICLNAGMLDFLAKPITGKDVAQQLKNMLLKKSTIA